MNDTNDFVPITKIGFGIFELPSGSEIYVNLKEIITITDIGYSRTITLSNGQEFLIKESIKMIVDAIQNGGKK